MKTETTLYNVKCNECFKFFETDKPLAHYCPECLKFRKPRISNRKKKAVKKVLTFAEILHIANIYAKVNHKYLHYGDIVALLDQNAEHCVCCGDIVPEGKQVCHNCEKAVE